MLRLPFLRNNKQPASQNGHAGHADALILLRGVTKSYATPAGAFQALKSIDLEVAPGEFVAVIGKSGSGKSTLSNMITGIDRPSQGEVRVAGTAVHQLREGQIAIVPGEPVGKLVVVVSPMRSKFLAEAILRTSPRKATFDNGCSSWQIRSISLSERAAERSTSSRSFASLSPKNRQP